VIPPAIFFYYSTLFDSRFKTLQQNPNSKVKGVFKNMLKSMMLSILKNATILMKFGKQIILC
ncbi:hypothetical protein P7H98_12390, partial [Lactococcus lactis]